MDTTTKLLAALLLSASFTQAASAAEPTANIAAFADQTIALLSNPNTALTADETFLVRPYLDPGHPDVAASLDLYQRSLQLIIQITDYSLDVAQLSDFKGSDESQVAAYADHLDGLREQIVANAGVDEAQLNATLDRIRGQTQLLDAMRAAQPIINAVGRYSQDLANEYDDVIQRIADRVGGEIDARHQNLIDYQEVWQQRQGEVLLGYTKLAEPVEPDMRALNVRLDLLTRIRESLTPSIARYEATHEELQRVREQALEGSNNVRLAMLTWVRAHAKMASGVKDSAAWWDPYSDIVYEAGKFTAEALKD